VWLEIHPNCHLPLLSLQPICDSNQIAYAISRSNSISAAYKSLNCAVAEDDDFGSKVAYLTFLTALEFSVSQLLA
jgi:hypothetical protein